MKATLRISDVFLQQTQNMLKTFPGDWSNSFMVIALNYFRKRYFEKY